MKKADLAEGKKLGAIRAAALKSGGKNGAGGSKSKLAKGTSVGAKKPAQRARSS